MRRMLTITSGALMAVAAISGASVAGASASPARSGTEHLQFMTTSPFSNNPTVIGTGLFTAGGTDTEHSSTRATLTFPGGKIEVRHSKGIGRPSFNPRTCLFSLNARGTYRLLSGTGKYAGIHGHGTYQLSILAVGARNSKGGCSRTKPQVAWEQVIRASGPVSLP